MAPKWKYYFRYISAINLAFHLMLDVTRVDDCISTLLNLPLRCFARVPFFLLFNQHRSIIQVSVYSMHVCMYRHMYVDDYSNRIHYSSLNIVLTVKSWKKQ